MAGPAVEMAGTSKVLVTLLTVFLVGVSFASLPVERATADLPSWSIGDSWTYLGAGVPYPPAQPTQVVYTVTGTEPILENGTSIPTCSTEVWLNTTGTAPIHVADEWYRTSDLAIARLVVYYYRCSYAPAGLYCSNSTATVTPEPPLPLHFPMKAGDAWSASTWVVYEVLNRDTGSTSWSNFTGGANYSVGPDETIALPAGNLSGTPLSVNYSQAARFLLFSYSFAGSVRVAFDFSSAVGNAVRIREYASSLDGSGFYVFALLELESYHHAATWYNAKVLGLPLWSWLSLAAAIALAGVTVFLRRRKSRRKPATAPESSSSPSSEPPTKLP